MNTPTIRIDCASCGTTYRLPLPKVLVTKPHKSMSFRCNNCSYKFQIQPKEILDQPEVAKTLILVDVRDKLHIPSSIDEVKEGVKKGHYFAEDIIRLYGKQWALMGDVEELKEAFSEQEHTIVSAFRSRSDIALTSAVRYYLLNNKDSPVEGIYDKVGALDMGPVISAIVDYCKDNPAQSDTTLEEALSSIIEKMLKEHYNQ